MRRFLIGLFAVLSAVVSSADTVTVAEAVAAAENWVVDGAAMGLTLTGSAVGAQTFRNAPGDNAVHVVSFGGGGFVITVGDADYPIGSADLRHFGLFRRIFEIENRDRPKPCGGRKTT